VLLHKRTAKWNPFFVELYGSYVPDVVLPAQSPHLRGLYFHFFMLFNTMFQTSGGRCPFENNELLRSRKTGERTRVHQQWSPQDRACDFQEEEVFAKQLNRDDDLSLFHRLLRRRESETMSQSN